MKRSVMVLATTPCLVATILATPAAAATSAHDRGADSIRAWNEITVTALVTAKTPAPEQPLYLAYVHRAVYNAVLRTSQSHRHRSVQAAVVSAAHDVLVANFPDQRAVLDDDYATSLAAVPVGRDRRIGLAVGASAAQQVLHDRAHDGRNGTPLPVPPAGPGTWIPTPPNAIGTSSWLGTVRPFELRSPSEFRPAGPPTLTSAAWTADYNETRLLGSATSTLRTPTQTEVARFWADPPFVQNQRALRAYTQTQHLSAEATARVFALADTASADALIACFDAKYTYKFWRPFSAIPAGDTDGNPDTPADPGWTPLLPTPNFPEYTSAHSCSTTAIVTVLAGLDRHHRLNLDMDSVTTGTTHHFSSVGQLTEELANARVWGGLHWRFSTLDGARLGAAVARVVLNHCDCSS
jgi:hypothetical protein